MNKFQNIEDFTDKQKEEFYKRIGSNVARIRKKHKLSQLKLSLLIGHKSTSLLAGAEIYYNKQHFSLEHLANISFVLNEESPLPYHFDIVVYNQITNADLKEHIDRVGVIIYARQ